MAATRHERRRSNAWRRFCASISERAASRGACHGMAAATARRGTSRGRRVSITSIRFGAAKATRMGSKSGGTSAASR
jgi:hypothetical protein